MIIGALIFDIKAFIYYKTDINCRGIIQINNHRNIQINNEIC